MKSAAWARPPACHGRAIVRAAPELPACADDQRRTRHHLRKDAAKDRAFLKDVLGLPHVDVGGGWLIFGLPPAEVAVHPSEKNGNHELYFMCSDIVAFKKALRKKRIASSKVMELGWGRLCRVALPGGGEIGVYEPMHARPSAPSSRKSRPTKAQKPAMTKKKKKKARKKR